MRLQPRTDGLPYKADVDHLIESIFREDNQLYIKQSGLVAAESLLYNRVWMYEILYKHKDVRKFEGLLTNIVGNFIKQSTFSGRIPGFFTLASSSNVNVVDLKQEYFRLTEWDMWSFIGEISRSDHEMTSFAKLMNRDSSTQQDPDPLEIKLLDIAKEDLQVSITGQGTKSLSEIIIERNSGRNVKAA